MDFTEFLIEYLIEEHNREAQGSAMGLPTNPDKDSAKGDRFQYGNFMIQPPSEHHKKNQKDRVSTYHKIVDFTKMLQQAIAMINKKGLSDTFSKSRKPGGGLAVIRLISDPKNEYAEMYQQEDNDGDGDWDAGDFIFNLDAKNNNIHTIIHSMGHKDMYEVLSDPSAEEWKDYYELRKYRDQQEFVTKYAAENHREDYAETYAVYVMGPQQIDSLYDKRRTNKDVECIQKILKRFKQLRFKKK